MRLQSTKCLAENSIVDGLKSRLMQYLAITLTARGWELYFIEIFKIWWNSVWNPFRIFQWLRWRDAALKLDLVTIRWHENWKMSFNINLSFLKIFNSGARTRSHYDGNDIISIILMAMETRMHSSRMRTACCNWCFSCITRPPPAMQTPPAKRTPLSCMPPPPNADIYWFLSHWHTMQKLAQSCGR